MKRLASILLVVAIGACDDSFSKGWLVDRTRILGARIDEQPTRVSWLVAAPDRRPHLEWSYVVCAASDGRVPEPRCTSPVLAQGNGAGDGPILPMSLTDVPTRDRDLWILAAFCEGSAVARFDAEHFDATCASQTPALLASATLAIAPNDNPAIAQDDVLLDGAALIDGHACVPRGSKHTLTFRFRAHHREPADKTLVVSHVVTAGELERQYSALEPSEGPKDVPIAWTAPSEPRNVELFFVLRDGRGGAGFFWRSICVQP